MSPTSELSVSKQGDISLSEYPDWIRSRGVYDTDHDDPGKLDLKTTIQI